MLITFDENNHTGIENNTNYTLVVTFDGEYLRAWLNNIQIEKNTFTERVVAESTSALRLGLYRTTSNVRHQGEIHFVYIYNYTLTPEQVVNRTTIICGSNLYPSTSQRYGLWPLSNTTLPDWSNYSSYDRLVDVWGYRPFNDHPNDLDFHRGIDLSNDSGLPIYAVMNGTVDTVENASTTNNTARERFGNWVLIEHTPDPDTGQPRHTAYMHLNQTPAVVVNQSLRAGDIIGYTGKSGSSIYKDHLHFELLLDLNENVETGRTVYGNVSAVHPFGILDYTEVSNTSLWLTESNSSHYFINFSQGADDLDFVRIKMVGTTDNRTIDYQTKEGLDRSDPDTSCVNDVCFVPGEWDFPYERYSMSFTVPKISLGTLEGVILEDVRGNQLIVNTTAPEVSSLLPILDSDYEPNEVIEISANVTDDGKVSVVLANLTLPNATRELITLANRSDFSEKYNYSYTLTSLTGTYNLMIIANDTQGNINDSESTSFTMTEVAISTTPSGGGGGGSTTIIVREWCGDQICQNSEVCASVGINNDKGACNLDCGTCSPETATASNSKLQETKTEETLEESAKLNIDKEENLQTQNLVGQASGGSYKVLDFFSIKLLWGIIIVGLTILILTVLWQIRTQNKEKKK